MDDFNNYSVGECETLAPSVLKPNKDVKRLLRVRVVGLQRLLSACWHRRGSLPCWVLSDWQQGFCLAASLNWHCYLLRLPSHLCL